MHKMSESELRAARNCFAAHIGSSTAEFLPPANETIMDEFMKHVITEYSEDGHLRELVLSTFGRCFLAFLHSRTRPHGNSTFVFKPSRSVLVQREVEWLAETRGPSEESDKEAYDKALSNLDTLFVHGWASSHVFSLVHRDHPQVTVGDLLTDPVGLRDFFEYSQNNSDTTSVLNVYPGHKAFERVSRALLLNWWESDTISLKARKGF